MTKKSVTAPVTTPKTPEPPPAPFTDLNGVVWYRPRYDGSSPPHMAGWTSDSKQAHEAYGIVASVDTAPTDDQIEALSAAQSAEGRS